MIVSGTVLLLDLIIIYYIIVFHGVWAKNRKIVFHGI